MVYVAVAWYHRGLRETSPSLERNIDSNVRMWNNKAVTIFWFLFFCVGGAFLWVTLGLREH